MSPPLKHLPPPVLVTVHALHTVSVRRLQLMVAIYVVSVAETLLWAVRSPGAVFGSMWRLLDVMAIVGDVVFGHMQGRPSKCQRVCGCLTGPR